MLKYEYITITFYVSNNALDSIFISPRGLYSYCGYVKNTDGMLINHLAYGCWEIVTANIVGDRYNHMEQIIMRRQIGIDYPTDHRELMIKNHKEGITEV